ncbi:DUF5691 domain-containing protein [Chitinophaga filiformis]|uniref:DUF5691 domain-containing protein n=1 Tax=Chitinophaga filiformis TaxID=104663 RepID=UPI001F397798|nr:DUF5691 domain-containing protein [Chitinophaga filiformis]MCF6401895.1 DUF5691 domain-containing protein [Chitinophaga filiformis]
MWNNIINTALLGTGKKQLTPADLPADLVAVAEKIMRDKRLDVETQFLHIAAVMLNYRQSGVNPVNNSGIPLQPAPAEERSYCSTQAVYALQDALDMDLLPLVTYWLEACHDKGQIVVPEYVPVLLDTAVSQKRIRHLAMTVCGKRGQWLSSMNPDWQFPFAVSNEDRWQTGSPEDRRQVLQEIRQSYPGMAREWLQQTWAQENISTRTEFLKIMRINISEDDLPWLESLQEKNQKVKDEVWALLKQIPSSFIVQAYWQILQHAISCGPGQSLHISLQLPLDKRIIESGIATLSNEKNISEEAYILFQLMGSVPPSWWESLFNADKEEVFGLFEKDDLGKRFIPALILAAGRFKDAVWLRLLLEKSTAFYPDVIPLLPAAEQEAYALRLFSNYPQDVINYLSNRTDEWGLAITSEVLKWMARNPYQYTRNFFDKHVLQLPPVITDELEKLAPEEPAYQATWRNTSEHIRKLLSCKVQINNAFK